MTADSTQLPICVDLDGTLVRTDLLLESALLLIKRRPYLALLFPFWLLKGRAFLKRQIAQRAVPEPATLPYAAEVAGWLRSERASGRRIVLATATDEIIATKIAAHCGFFSEVLASDGQTNLKGHAKRDRLVDRFGAKGFVYAGNSLVDVPVWDQAAEAVVVGGNGLAAQTRTPVSRVFAGETRLWRGVVRALRIHQWVKNLLVFVPIIAAHRLADVTGLAHVLLAFGSFCLCASAIYVVNDLLDLGADRGHPIKRQRPFASGDLPLASGLLLVPVFLAGSFACGILVGAGFLVTLALYLVLTLAYSLLIKSVVLMDVMCLASLYTIRVFAGGLAAAVPVSNWLLAFSVFFFLSLAMAKRASELFHLKLRKEGSPEGRGYLLTDLQQLSSMGAGSGYISVLVLALYISSAEVRAFYEYPERLWFVCPLIFYWISRIWLLTHRGQIQEDPLVFALKDKISYAVGLLVCLVLMLSTGHR